MKSKKNIFILRLINGLLFAVLIFVHYSSTFSLKIAHINPLLPLALLVPMCMFCSEVTAAFSGLFVGIFMDCVAATPQGFNAIILMIIGVCAAIIIRHLFNNNIFSSIALCALCTSFYYLVRWFFRFAFTASFTENLTFLLQTILPCVLYTSVLSIPFYYLERALYKKFYR